MDPRVIRPGKIRFYTLGRFELRSAGSGAGTQVSMQPKRLGLLAYLALATPRGFQRRDSLLALFWPEASQEEARNALRQALHHLRQQLGEGVIETRADDQIALVDHVVWCDAVELEAANAAGDVARAVDLYQGSFLDAVFIRGVAPELEEWIDRTRTRLRSTAADAAKQLSERALSEERPDAAISAARRRCDIEPDNEAAVRALLSLLDSYKGRAEAIAEAERFRQSLRQRYELDPSAETEALIGAIRSGSRRGPVDESDRGDRSDSAVDPPAANPIATRVAEPTSRSRFNWWYAATVPAIAMAAWLGVRASRSTPAQGQRVTSVDRIFVADFADRTPQTTFGSLVASALRVDLAQSPRLRVLTAAQVRSTLRLMDRPLEEALDDSLARIIAIREGAKGFVAGDVHAVGQTIVVTARLVAASTGDQLAAAREVARDSSDIIGAIERLSRSLRHRVGENLAEVSEALPLSRVTTASITALQKYSEGLHFVDLGERAEGIARLEQAVAIDSGFATAYRILGASYAALGEPARAAEALERAFANRTRLPYRERYLLMGSYYRNATGEYDKAVAAYRALLAVDPNDIAALNNLGLTLTSVGNHAAAESLFTRVVAADSTQVNARLVLAEAMASQGRFVQARGVLDETARRFPEHPVVGLTRIYVAAAESDWPNAERFAAQRLAMVTATVQRIDALQTLGQIELLMGRLTAARAHLEESMRLARAEESPRRYLWAATRLAWLDLRYRGRADDAQRRIRRALEVYPSRTLSPDDVPASELVGLTTALGMAGEARAFLPAADTAGGRTGRTERQYMVGLIDAAENRWAGAVAALRSASAQLGECSICSLSGLAAVEEGAGNVAQAISAAERYVNTPYIYRFEPDAAHLGETLMRLGRLYERQSDTTRAVAAYERLMRVWSNADAELEPMVDSVRTRIGRLKQATR